MCIRLASLPQRNLNSLRQAKLSTGRLQEPRRQAGRSCRAVRCCQHPFRRSGREGNAYSTDTGRARPVSAAISAVRALAGICSTVAR